MKSPKDKWLRFLLSLWFWISKNNLWNILSINFSQLQNRWKSWGSSLTRVISMKSPKDHWMIFYCHFDSVYQNITIEKNTNRLLLLYTLTIILNTPSKHLLQILTFWVTIAANYLDIPSSRLLLTFCARCDLCRGGHLDFMNILQFREGCVRKKNFHVKFMVSD